MDPSVRWLTVTNAESADVVRKYLYSTAALVTSFGEDTHIVVVVSTWVPDIDHLANYQSDRMRSGLMGVSIYETFAEALEAVR